MKDTYNVNFKYARGAWRGKKVLPLDEYLQEGNLKLELYSEKQIKPVICEILRKKEGIKIPYVVDIHYTRE